MIVASVDQNQVMTNLDNISKAVEGGMDQGLLDAGFELLRLSQFEVPHDEGELQNSGTVEEIDGDVVVGYHKKYAARLHEHPEYNFQKGRKGKYLEDPLITNQDALAIKVVKKLDGKIRRSIR